MSKVLIYDCDGVLADTELHGHLVAFNRMWEEFGVPWKWTQEEYGRKLKIGGGKERMASLFSDPSFISAYQAPESDDARRELIASWHRRKTAIYKEIIASGAIPARSGVKRLSQEALSKGWILAVASTSTQESVEAVLKHAVGEDVAARFSLVLAGDVVSAKKPAPDIYLLAAEKLGVSPAECVVVEDSRSGLLAARSAGMKCVITVNGYTRDQDFAGASMVLTCLGDPGREECEVLANNTVNSPRRYLTVDDLGAP